MNPLLRKIPLMRTCKEVTALVVAREDRELSTSEQLILRMHMAMCKACPRFERQMFTMRSAMKQWRHYGGNDE
ncbi:zf-HC2 domain-containing protein [Hydrogenophaga sp. PAMC20947]|nr:zf-HC2 domain-containing protein [Hydrogenophaga sp. PAMC20947]